MGVLIEEAAKALVVKLLISESLEGRCISGASKLQNCATALAAAAMMATLVEVTNLQAREYLKLKVSECEAWMSYDSWPTRGYIRNGFLTAYL